MSGSAFIGTFTDHPHPNLPPSRGKGLLLGGVLDAAEAEVAGGTVGGVGAAGGDAVAVAV